MRQRKLRHLDEKLAELSDWYDIEPGKRKGAWRDFVPGDGERLYAEIGCGKGQFITSLAAINPDCKFIGIEGQESCAYHAITKAREKNLSNVRYVMRYVDSLEDMFEDDELDGIYLNFSDPWPKARHEKRRLTTAKRLTEYARAVKRGGFIEFRTDNDDLFEFTIGEVVSAFGVLIEEMSLDLHADKPDKASVTTEYEDKFAGMGRPIHYVRLRVLLGARPKPKPPVENPDEEEDFSAWENVRPIRKSAAQRPRKIYDDAALAAAFAAANAEAAAMASAEAIKLAEEIENETAPAEATGKEKRMSDLIFAEQNGRTIPAEDMIFAISGRANARIAEIGKENVINATVGMLLDDDGEIMVLSSVDKAFRMLKPGDYARYAPIGGTPGFKAAAIKSAFGSFVPKRKVRAVAGPGGTGALKLAVANYSAEGDTILTTDWHWGTYDKIAGEIGRTVRKFRLFNEQGGFDQEAYREGVKELLEKQDSLLIILNTPANNPTGYCLTDAEWMAVCGALTAVPKDKKVALCIDTAYIDFAGPEDEARTFLPLLDLLPDNVMPMLAFSFSKTFTLYGMRTGALICMAPSDEIADEFVRVCEYTARASWSNCNRSGHVLIEKIFADPELLAAVTAERAEIRNMLLERGRAFSEEAAKVGLEMLPFDGGFFAVIPHPEAKKVAAALEEMNIFAIPFGAGLRVSLASTPLENCKKLPAKILEAMNK